MESNNSNNSVSSFPRHRRRPLMSETYTTFNRLLALSRHPAFSSPAQDDSGDGKVEQLHDISDNKCENASIDSVSVDNKSEQDRDFSDTQVKVGGLDSKNVPSEANEEFARENGNLNDSHCVVGENKVDDQVVEIDSDRNDEQFALALDSCDSEAYSHGKELKGDEDIRIREVCESIEKSLNIDMVTELSKRDEDGEVKGDEEMEQELQRRQTELEKMILGADDVDSTQCVDVDGDIEEGEISREDGAYDGSIDALSEGDTVEEKKAEEGQVCKDVTDKEKFAREIGQNEVGKCNAPTSLFQSTMDKSNVMIEKKKESTREDQACNYDLLARGKYVETQKADSHDDFLHETRGIMRQVGRAMSDNAGAGLEDPSPIGKFTPQVVAKTQSYGTDGQDASASEKKRKRGPLTKEKRAKKKKKERIKRAEKNRKLGVKRLKIQPLVKPKTVTYCRHYLNGRCQEGENCKFSHDTIPLTKSKPCCHFARHSCMKGDDCPFDHQLSKYPCNNFVTSGFCSRGAGCLFSHKIAANEGSVTTSTALETGRKSPTILPDSKKLENIHGTSQHNVDAKSYSTGMPAAKSTEHNVAVPVQKRTAQPPKGINIFSHGKSSPTDIGKPKQLAGQPSTTHDDIKLGHEKVHRGADNREKVNEVERAARRTPKGINFLSFGKAPLNDTSGHAVSSLFPDSGIGKSILGDQSRRKEIAPSSKTDDSVIVSNLYGQTPSVLPSAAPHGTSFFSFGKVSSDHSSSAQHSSSHPSEGNSASEYAHQSAPLKFEYPSGVLYRPAFSALPEKSAAENSIGMGSSSKTSIFSNTPSSVPKALQSTLAFAAKFDPCISSRSLSTNFDKKAESSQNKSVKGLTVLDVLYGDSSKTKP